MINQERSQKILDQLTLEEKIALCSGGSFWCTKSLPDFGLKEVTLCDGPSGLRKQEKDEDMLGIHDAISATCFPAAVTTACSWDPDLIYRVANAIGEEALQQGVGVVLGPGICIKRNPLCGRNFEYFSEDPYLSGKLAVGFLNGLQETGVGGCLKHFACNGQEYKRFSSDSRVDERTLREIYLTAFEIAVQEGNPAAVMCAYNKVNGTYCSDNKKLLTDILRNEWGFEGVVVTDWGAMHDRIEGFRAGCDLSMPGGSNYMEEAVLQAVQNGTLPQKKIEESAARVLQLMHRSPQLFWLRTKRGSKLAEHSAVARQAAEESAVLLKNEDQLLPLDAMQSVALLGKMGSEMRFQGGGSSHITPTQVLEINHCLSPFVYDPCCNENGEVTPDKLYWARKIARQVDVPVVVIGLPENQESEGFDRDDMKLPEGDNALVHAVAEMNSNTVVVLLSGSPVEVPWADEVKAILYMGLPGQCGGEAIANLLYGLAEPGGRLAETWPNSYQDCPSWAEYGEKNPRYREGIYVGYRYYETAGEKVRWPFGYGLSYTTFAYDKPQLHKQQVNIKISNVGDRAGWEVVQMYVKPPQGGLHRPAIELKGFRKVYLQPGESIYVTFPLTELCFRIWQDGWKVPGGTYTIYLGRNVRDLCQSVTITLPGESIPAPSWQSGSWYEMPHGNPFTEDWSEMSGDRWTESPLQRGAFTKENTLTEMKSHSVLIWLLYWGIRLVLAHQFGGVVRAWENPAFQMMLAATVDCSLSGMQINSGRPGPLFDGLLDLANGYYLRGLRILLGDGIRVGKKKLQARWEDWRG